MLCSLGTCRSQMKHPGTSMAIAKAVSSQWYRFVIYFVLLLALHLTPLLQMRTIKQHAHVLPSEATPPQQRVTV